MRKTSRQFVSLRRLSPMARQVALSILCGEVADAEGIARDLDCAVDLVSAAIGELQAKFAGLNINRLAADARGLVVLSGGVRAVALDEDELAALREMRTRRLESLRPAPEEALS
ncbi:MAG: hypothetical protein GC160_02880 [Acidobacteria bacterium]|nr:hypothetical protein [Acidobacteriota bacterium]